MLTIGQWKTSFKLLAVHQNCMHFSKISLKKLLKKLTRNPSNFNSLKLYLKFLKKIRKTIFNHSFQNSPSITLEFSLEIH